MKKRAEKKKGKREKEREKRRKKEEKGGKRTKSLFDLEKAWHHDGAVLRCVRVKNAVAA